MSSAWLHCVSLGLLITGVGVACRAEGPLDSTPPRSGVRAEQGPERAKGERFYERFFGRQLPVSTASETWEVTMGSEPCAQCIAGKAFVFTAVRKGTGGKYRIRLANSPVQVDEADLVGESRLVVFGRNVANFVQVYLLALPTGTAVDSFGCYYPSLSPGHRLLAYVKAFPPHPGPVEVNYEYISYDLTRSPDYNRPHFKAGVSYDPGWPLYPPGVTNAVGEDLLPQNSPVHALTSDGLFWLDDVRVAFTDRFERLARLVVADLSAGIVRPEVRSVHLDASSTVDLGRCRQSMPEDFALWSTEPAVLTRVNQIELSPDKGNQVRLGFAPSSCLKSTELTVRLP